MSRREFLAATGSAGALGLAGCTAPTEERVQAAQTANQATNDASIPSTSPPEVVDVDEQGGSVTLKSAPAHHAVHPLETMGGPVELPRVWAFQADDADPGIYLMHCHKVNHVMNDGFYPGGMLGGVVYESALDTDVFRQLMKYAGYEAC